MIIPANANSPSTIKSCKFDSSIKTMNHNMMLMRIVNDVKALNIKDINIDLVKLASNLSALDQRMTKTVMEMVMEYKTANRDNIPVMGKSDATPYKGHYDKSSNSTTFDLNNFPDSLIVILYKFDEIRSAYANNN